MLSSPEFLYLHRKIVMAFQRNFSRFLTLYQRLFLSCQKPSIVCCTPTCSLLPFLFHFLFLFLFRPLMQNCVNFFLISFKMVLMSYNLLVTQFTISSVQFSSVTQSCPTLCDPMYCSTPGLPVHHQLPESTQTHAHR